MKIFLLALLAMCQEPMTIIGPPIQHELKYCRNIKTKKYISAVMTNGKKIEIPIVNGFLPEIKTFHDTDGIVIKRIFVYNSEIPYTGGTPQYRLSDTPIQQDCNEIPRDIESMKVPLKEPSTNKVQGTPIESILKKEPDNLMKRPSEVQGKKRFKPNY